MNTCLASLWSILIEQYNKSAESVHEQFEDECKQKINHLINCFYFETKMCKPSHVKAFQQELLRDGCSIGEAAGIAGRKADKCGLCAVCSGCAEKFYAVLQGNRTERPLPPELKNYFSESSQLYYYLTAYKTVRSYRSINNTLICLKGFSSTTPAIYPAAFEGTCAGGGLYLNVDGFGVVIDPGISFVDSMHKQGIFIQDINAVIVTHNHLDHNADVGIISALQYDVNRYYNSQAKFYRRFFRNINNEEHKIGWWLDEGTQDTTQEIIPESRALSECSNWTALNDQISVIAMGTKHMQKGKSYGIKCRIRLGGKEIVIGYTSDTRYFPEIADFMKESDIIVFNISDIYEKDVRGIRQKKSHLGYNGSINLLQGENQNFRLAIASEFCCSNGDYRMRVVRKLNDRLHGERNAFIIPGEVGLKVGLESLGIYCSHCRRVAPLDAISVAAPDREFGTLQYICKNCQYMQE